MDAYVFAKKTLSNDLIKGADFTSSFFDDEEQNWSQELKDLEKPVCAARLPFFLPKTRGHRLLHGSINASDAADSLKAYHGIAFKWITFMPDFKDVAVNDIIKIPELNQLLTSENLEIGKLNSITIRYVNSG